MKHVKRLLSVTLAAALLMACCAGLSFSSLAGESEWYWNLVEDWSFSVADGSKFANAKTFSVQIPEGPTNSDLQLHLNVTLNAVAAAQMAVDSTVELDNYAQCDTSEIQWSTAGKWKEGDNDVYLLFSQGADGAGANWKGNKFSIGVPIVYCRMFSNANSNGAGSVKVNYIRVETTQAYRDGGINFSEDESDTYLRLTDPLSATPNTIEAAVKLEALPEEEQVTSWQVYNGASNGANTGWGGTTDRRTVSFETWATEGTDEQPAAGTKYVQFAWMDNGSNTQDWACGFTAPTSVRLPKEYLMQDLALSFWMYIGDISALNNTGIWLRLSTSTSYDKDYLPCPNSKNWGLKQGWNHVVLPLSDFGNPTSANFDLYNLNLMEFRNVSFTKPSVFRLADMKIIATGGPSGAGEVKPQKDTFYTVFSDECDDTVLPIALKINTKNGNPVLLWGGKKLVADCNVCTGERVHIAAVRDTEAKKLILYVDGEKVAESADYPTANIVPSEPHAIGATAAGEERFPGVIADLRVWSVSRTADEIAANTEPGSITGDEEGLLGAWMLRGNITHVLDTLKDSVGKNPVVFAGTRADQWIDYEVPEEIGDDYYTLVWVPDPQNVTISKGLQQWNDDMDWIAANVEKENIFHVASAGDDTWTDSVGTWNIVKNSFAKFWDKVSWSSCTGNHDYPGSTNDSVHYRDTTNYNNALGLAQIQSTAAKDTFAGWYEDDGKTPETAYVKHPSGTENSYYLFTINGVNWMLLQLEYQPRPSVLKWANEVLKQYPDYNVILVTHSLIGGSKDPKVAEYQGCWMNYTKEEKAAGDFTDNTQSIYTNVVEPNSNVKMVLCGHASNPSYGEAVLSRNETRKDGSVVYQMMLNAQYLDTDDSTNFAYYNDRCMGMLGLFRFSADGTKVAVNWYCPSDDKTYEPNPDGNDPATTMGPNPHSLSNFVLPIDLVINTLPLREAVENAYEDLSACTKETADAYNKAVADAKELLEDGEYDQDDLDAALAAIEAADAALVSTVDKSALEAAVNAAVEDLSAYTEESVAAYTAALEAAEVVLADKSADKAAVDAALDALVAAENGLTATAILGDVNGDEKVDSTDARLILQYYAKKIDADALNLGVADVDGSGTVDSTDARLILQLYAKKISSF